MTPNPTFNYYGADIKQTVPMGQLTLNQMIRAIRSPKAEMLDVLSKISYYSEQGDMDEKARYKKQLYFFTPAVLCTRRRYEDIINFTGLAPLDFDKLDTHKIAIEFKEYLFNSYPYIIAVWLSSSKLGVRALLNIPICNNVDEYKQYYDGFEQIAYKYNGYDRAPKNAVLPLFYSDDSNLLYRSDSAQWQTKYTAPEPKPHPANIRLYDTDLSRKVVNIIRNGINDIHDYGHPPLRALAFAVGGYVANGYINSTTAKQVIENEIRNNSYLGTKNKVNGYIKTANEMIDKGQLQPLTL